MLHTCELGDCLYKKPVDLHKDDFSTDEQSMDGINCVLVLFDFNRNTSCFSEYVGCVDRGQQAQWSGETHHVIGCEWPVM